jgi:superfamily II DNA/RNA helicase
MTFADLGVSPALIAALAKRQITDPTPIQAAAYPVLSAGTDAYLLAETGTGKTLAYLLPLFCRLDPTVPATQLVIVGPTHELALQIQRECCALAQHAGWPLSTLLLIGGTPVDRQIAKLKKKPHVVVGSPGRIRELIQLGKLKAQQIKCVVIDEADRLLVDESLPVIRELLQVVPCDRQLVFVSATAGAQSAAVIATLAPELVMVQPTTTPMTAKIEHLYLVCEERDKPQLLRSLLAALRPARTIAFVHRAETAERVAANLTFHHVAVAQLHGAIDKQQRKEAMDDFRRGRAGVLIASDVAARGLDIPGVTHIVNLDAPLHSKAYLHRVGRTARAGASGMAITLLTSAEAHLPRQFAKELGIVMKQVRLREGRLLELEG